MSSRNAEGGGPETTFQPRPLRMILVDTSVWMDHLRRGNARLAALLQDAQVAIHAFVIGEVASPG